MRNKKKILIIDDEIDLSLLLKEYFVRKNYAVSVSHSLKEGRSVISSLLPEVLFLDNNLPDGTGWNIAPGLASAYPSMYIVLISAFHPSVPHMPATARYRVIEKPITLADLDKQFSEL